MKRALRLVVVSAVLLFGAIGCNTDSRSADSHPPRDSVALDSIARARQDSINRRLPGYVVDSILPVEEELRRFRAAVGGGEVSALKGGAASRDSLVKKFLERLEASDTNALKAMLLTPVEFAWLVYPESPYAKPPYTQAPALVWNQIQNHSSSGMIRLVRRMGGLHLRFAGYRCSKKVDRQGINKIWTRCIAGIGGPGEPVRDRRLFGSIIERDGHFKFVSFSNEF